MNSHAKGVRTEALAQTYYEKQGCIVERTRWSRFGRKDFFGFADLIVVSKAPTQWTKPILVQVTSENGKSKRKALLRENIAFLQRGFRVRLLVRIDRKGWEEFDLQEDGSFLAL